MKYFIKDANDLVNIKNPTFFFFFFFIDKKQKIIEAQTNQTEFQSRERSKLSEVILWKSILYFLLLDWIPLKFLTGHTT